MAFEKTADKVYDTDVLVVGGGTAGCPAAAKAAEKGLRVIMVEKAKTERSGHAGAGIDTVMDFIREGVSVLDYVRLLVDRQHVLNGEGRFFDPNISRHIASTSWWSLEEMERLGYPMRWDDGEYHWMRNVMYEGDRTQLGVHWLDIKPKMAEVVKKKGAQVLDRTMIVDLLTHKGRVVGITAIDTRSGEFIVIKAKMVIMAAGPFARSYEPETPQFYKYKMRYHGAPGAIAGDGWAAGYRAGAELANMDIGNLWSFRLRDDITMPVGTVAHGDGVPGRTVNSAGEMPFPTARIYQTLEQRGLDPIYMTIENFSEDYQKRAEIAIADERMISLKLAEDRMFDPHSHRYEVMVPKPHNFATISGLTADEDFKTSLDGLYVVGDCGVGLSSCGPAVMSGLLTAEKAPDCVSAAGEPVIDEGQVESQKQAALAPLSVKDGTMPMELECAVRYINERYVGLFKSEGKLLEGQRRLSSLKREFLPKLMAKNPHYLMRCIEARNILELTEVHLQACLARNESRGFYLRMDHPERDPSRDDMVTYQRMEKGKAVIDIREVPDLKPEYTKGGK